MSADDDSFHPLGKEWENDLEDLLDDTEYDSDLGMDMARDAMRVTKGELSEAEFHEKYHEDVMEEFGEDQRPTLEAYEAAEEEAKGTFSRMLDAFDGDGEETRRDTMKKMGVGAAAVGLGAFGSMGDGQPSLAEEEGASAHTEAHRNEDIQWGMTIDLEQCDGCLSCVVACSEENQLDQGVNWMYVLDYEDPDTPDTSRNRLVRPCQHCTDAPCEKVCPTTARHTRDKDGLVLTDYDVCIGCRYCQVACPYGVNYFQWDEPDVAHDDIPGATDYYDDDIDAEEVTHAEYEHGEERWVDARAPRGTMSKCTMCPSHQDGNRGEDMVGTTACEEACTPGAIQFGNVQNENSDASRYADDPTLGRTVYNVGSELPDDLESQLEGVDSDIDSVIEAVEDLDEDILAVSKAVEIVSDDPEPPENESSTLVEREQTVLEAVEIFEDHGIDFEDEEVLNRLQLGDGEESGARVRLEHFAGTPDSNFKLLEDIGTHPNVQYLGNEPGPEAEQVEGPVSYEDVDLTDKRQEVLDDGTVGDLGVRPL